MSRAGWSILVLCAALSWSAAGVRAQDACVEPGTAVYYGNGMLNTFDEALDSALALRSLHTPDELDQGSNVDYFISYNHNEEAWTQLMQVVTQKIADDPSLLWRVLSGSENVPGWMRDLIDNLTLLFTAVEYLFDADLQAHVSDYMTRLWLGWRVLLVSHSQGNFYANAAYRLIPNRLSRSFANVQVATPASAVASGGPWVTFEDDAPIGFVRSFFGALPGNIHSSGRGVPPFGDPIGHSFQLAYLRVAESRFAVASDMPGVLHGTPYPSPEARCVGGWFGFGDDAGDPHLRTPDGLLYDFQARGEFVLLELADGPTDAEVHSFQRPLVAELCPNVTLNTAVAARVGNTVVAFYADQTDPLYVDDIATQLAVGESLSLADGGAVRRDDTETWTVLWPNESELRVQRRPWRGEHHLNLRLRASQDWRGRVRGLWGNFDGISGNDLALRDGTSLPSDPAWADLYGAFAGDYRVAATQSLFDASLLGAVPADADGVPAVPALSELLAPDAVEQATAICEQDGALPAELLEACVLDVVCSGGDASQADWAHSVELPREHLLPSYDSVPASSRIVNGSFEQSTLLPDRIDGYRLLPPGSTALDGWTITSAVDVVDDGLWMASDGSRSLDLSATQPPPGEISQRVLTLPGAGYHLLFDLASNVQCSPDTKQVQVSAGDQTQVFSFDRTGHRETDMGWTTKDLPFTASSDITTLSFKSLTNTSCGPALDNVRLEAAP